jgi:hypothetical protein
MWASNNGAVAMARCRIEKVRSKSDEGILHLP